MPMNLYYAIKEGLEEVQEQYDVILIDCPPGLSFFSSTALIGSDFFVSPIIPEPLSLRGVELVHDRARELSRDTNCKVEFAGVIPNIVKHYRNTHRNIADQVYGERRNEFKPFLFWLPDNERLRALGEFEIDPERIKDGWAGGVDNKFYGVYPKYAVSWLLNNPSPETGLLSQARRVEGERYRLHERIDKLVEEFGKKVGILA